jgi:hypothetical protein
MRFSLTSLIILFNTIPKLGYGNVAYILWYRLSLYIGIRKYFFPNQSPLQGIFFHQAPVVKEVYPESNKSKLLVKAEQLLNGDLTYFQKHIKHLENPPQWFLNPFTGKYLKEAHRHWCDIPDFELGSGDIKCIWELSRFDWLDVLARAYRITGNEAYLLAINQWLQDWALHNPVNIGPNWKCGQEASLRLLKMLHVAFCLSQLNQMSEVLCQFIFQHIKRIAGNTRYAIAQQNNHGISEAAGLYLGASVLLYQKIELFPNKLLSKWKDKGRMMLESQLLNLVEEDGTFSQKSTNYHRLVLDIMSQVLHLMDQIGEVSLPNEINEKLQAMGVWLYSMVCNSDGDVPFVGANDGALLEQSHPCSYVDFRPSLQLFWVLLNRRRLFTEGPWDEPIFWRLGEAYKRLELDPIAPYKNCIVDEDFVILSNSCCKVIIKLPNDHFRPGNDLFHLDVWINGINVLVSPGSYSYHHSGGYSFTSVSSFNTVQFGKHEPMPKLGRFLNGNWIKSNNSEVINSEDITAWEGHYFDSNGNRHGRKVILSLHSLKVEDKCRGTLPIIHWHVPYAIGYRQDITQWLKISNGEITLAKGRQSKFYLHSEDVLKVKIKPLGDVVVSEFIFAELAL